MHCFNHPDRMAIGTCKACCKGLCTECAIDLGHGLACKDRHEATVETYNSIVTRNATVYSAAQKGGSLLLPAFFAFMGLVTIGTGLFAGRRVSDSGLLMGAGFMVFGVIFYFYNRRVFGPRKSA